MGQISPALNLPLVAGKAIFEAGSIRALDHKSNLESKALDDLQRGSVRHYRYSTLFHPLPPRVMERILALVLSRPTTEKPLVLRLNNCPESSAAVVPIAIKQEPWD